MSDEERDVDIESDSDIEGDDDLGSLQKSGALGYGVQAERRAHHNALERKRRDHIKESFHGLRDSIPALQGEKSSRAQILKQATDYISHMSQKNNQHQYDIDDLKAQNLNLESQVRMLERAKTAGSYTQKLGGTEIYGAGTHSDSDSSDDSEPETIPRKRRKKLKT